MTVARTPMKCPRCGGGMNRHAEKLVFDQRAEPADLPAVDPEGVLVELHTCPGCGENAWRGVSPAGDHGAP